MTADLYAPRPARTELDVLLETIGKRGYFFYETHRGHWPEPDALAAVRDYGGTADVLILYDEDRACAFRTPTGRAFDALSPTHVYWYYEHSPVWTLRALVTLAPPGYPEAPDELIAMPPGYGIPPGERRPVRIRRRSVC
jgi:hypothetical protein